jgi:hypothetical protein
MQPVYVVNHRDYAVQVVFRNNTWSVADNRHFSCELQGQKPRLLRGTDVGNFNWREATEAESVFEASRCEIQLTLPPRSTVVIGWRELCSADLKYEEQGVTPRLNYLRIESPAGVVELTGWELVRALIERPGLFSNGDNCRYELT